MGQSHARRVLMRDRALAPQSTSASTRDRLPELDLLRFCAAFSVAIYHLCKWPAGGDALRSVAQLGFLGVQIFFVISGFVILMTAEHRTPIEFAKSRISRLYPTFWISVIVTSAALWIRGDDPPPAMIGANLTMIAPVFHQDFVDPVYWTLVVELRFYALVLLLLLFGQMRRIELWLGVWVAALCLSHLPLTPPLPRQLFHGLQWASLVDYGSLFAAGCYFYLVRTRGPSLRRFIPLGICLVLSIIDVCTVQDGSSYPWSSAQIDAMAIVVALIYAAFVMLSLRAWQLPVHPIWPWLGGLTYPLYLFHAQFGRILWGALPGSGWLRSGVVLVIALVVAAVLARYSERRACRALHYALDALERRLRARATRRQPTEVTATDSARRDAPNQPPKISPAESLIK
jgi:peptidoglycan/LPS O-acetylase OafA/YrhL